MNVLAISGSLRAASINTAFCRVASILAPESLTITVFGGLGALPLFNPDLESEPPPQVTDFRALVGRADGLLIASPEYAHGVSGVMKNALDWLVGFEGFVGKPVAVVNTSPRARHAYESLQEVLRTMSAALLSEPSVTLSLLGSCVSEDEMLESAAVSSQIRQALRALARTIRDADGSGPRFPVGPQ
jgi:NAD(P)H-dependent FMN reductase